MTLPRKVIYFGLAVIIFIFVLLLLYFFLSNFNQYKSAHFTLKTNDWVADVQNVTQGELIIFKPKGQSQTENYPNLTISYDPNPSLSVEEKITPFTSLGFVRSTTTLGGLTAIKLTGTFPYKVVNGNPIQSPVQETVILLEKGNVQYQIEYFYDGANVDLKQETVFTKMVDSVQL